MSNEDYKKHIADQRFCEEMANIKCRMDGRTYINAFLRWRDMFRRKIQPQNHKRNNWYKLKGKGYSVNGKTYFKGMINFAENYNKNKPTK